MAGEPVDGGLVLYAEDDRLNGELVAEIVALVAGARLRLEPTVAAAVAALAESTPALVLVDLDLPDGSGLEVIDAVRRAERHVPTFVVTGDTSSTAADEARARGADGVVVKPYRVADLVATIATALGGGSAAPTAPRADRRPPNRGGVSFGS